VRILLVNDLPPGPGSGVEVHLRRLVDALTAAGDEVEVVTAAGTRTGLSRALDVWDPAARRRVRATAERFRPDVVHHHNVLRELSMSVLGATPDVPVVLTVHDHRLLGGGDAGSPGPRAMAARAVAVIARRVVRRRADLVVALDDETARLLATQGFRHVARLELFADDPGEPRASAGSCTDVVFVGRLSPDKGAALLGAAFDQVADRHPQARLVLAGEGPERVALAALAARRPGRIELLGQVSAELAHDAMAAARVVVVPSVPELRAETGPQTILEAALRARPVITSAGVPLAALVRASDGGAVVPPGQVGPLADALDALLADGDRASDAGGRARTYTLAHHTPAAVVPQLRARYAGLAGVRPR
jgi:glycosyltransferase involved in cell wall biosynthesis